MDVVLQPLNGFGVPVGQVIDFTYDSMSTGVMTVRIQVPASITLTPAAGVTGSVPTATNIAGGPSVTNTNLGGNTFLQVSLLI